MEDDGLEPIADIVERLVKSLTPDPGRRPNRAPHTTTASPGEVLAPT